MTTCGNVIVEIFGGVGSFIFLWKKIKCVCTNNLNLSQLKEKYTGTSVCEMCFEFRTTMVDVTNDLRKQMLQHKISCF